MATKKVSIERKARVSKVPEKETKEQKFVRLTNHRVNKVRKALDQIGLLGGPSYVSTEEQRKRIAEAIQESVEFNLNRLEKVKPSKTSFSL
jgi:S-adenosylmethionine:tRNA-ribosyltransferase-isomerase (queuine synthetase)